MARQKHKEIILGVAGSIAAYKAVQLTGDFLKKDIEVTVVMTENAMRFVTPLTFETISRRPVISELQCDPASRVAEHVSLADQCSVLVIAPASANIIGKIASGIADDILSTTALSFSGPIVIAPAMNTVMWQNSIVQQNVEKLRELNYIFVGPEKGRLADGRSGAGRFAETDKILKTVEKLL